MNETAKIIFGLVGGLAMFLFGMNSMSDALQKAAGEKMKKADKIFWYGDGPRRPAYVKDGAPSRIRRTGPGRLSGLCRCQAECEYAVFDRNIDHFLPAYTHHRMVWHEFSKYAGITEWIPGSDLCQCTCCPAIDPLF